MFNYPSLSSTNKLLLYACFKLELNHWDNCSPSIRQSRPCFNGRTSLSLSLLFTAAQFVQSRAAFCPHVVVNRSATRQQWCSYNELYFHPLSLITVGLWLTQSFRHSYGTPQNWCRQTGTTSLRVQNGTVKLFNQRSVTVQLLTQIRQLRPTLSKPINDQTNLNTFGV
jgi:hypothetical protein